MWKSAAVLTLRTACLLAFVSCGRTPKVVQVTIEKVAFGPVPAGLAVGDTIEWVNKDVFDHTTTARSSAWDVVIPAGKTVRVVMKEAGTFEYYCKFHPNMTGTVAVKK